MIPLLPPTQEDESTCHGPHAVCSVSGSFLLFLFSMQETIHDTGWRLCSVFSANWTYVLTYAKQFDPIRRNVHNDTAARTCSFLLLSSESLRTANILVKGKQNSHFKSETWDSNGKVNKEGRNRDLFIQPVPYGPGARLRAGDAEGNKVVLPCKHHVNTMNKRGGNSLPERIRTKPPRGDNFWARLWRTKRNLLPRLEKL